MISFAELTKQVHLINDLILSDMVCDPDNSAEKAVNFSKHLLATKFWFARISYINKKRYLLVLLQDTRSAWTLSLLLKSMWNCRPKDAVMSVSERVGCFSSYDQVPMDHNRTALPGTTLALAMKNDHMWYLSLEPDTQALVLLELLAIAGGPVMWAVLHRAQTLYMRYQEQLLENLRDCIAVSESLNQKSNITLEKTIKRDQSSTITGMSKPVDTATSSRGQQNLEANLATWNATIKAMTQSLKLEEFEMTFNDGTKRKIWKVNRIKPDVMETVDFVQLLPSDVGKLVLSFLPRESLGEYARVNKYWAYLVDEYRSEVDARAKINANYTKLNEIVMKNDEILNEFIAQPDLEARPLSSIGMMSTQQPTNVPQNLPSVKTSEKSSGTYSLKYFSDKLNKPIVGQTPIRNMTELIERMEMRGAADENIWKWCGNIVAQMMRQKKIARGQKEVVMKGVKKAKKSLKTKTEDTEGILTLGNLHFPCPLMKHSLVVPLKQPLVKDPTLIKPSVQKKRCLSNGLLLHEPRENVKRYSLWTRDVSPLYPAFKIPSYQFPPNLLFL